MGFLKKVFGAKEVLIDPADIRKLFLLQPGVCLKLIVLPNS